MAELDGLADLLARVEQATLEGADWDAVDAALQELDDALSRGDEEAALAAMEDVEDGLKGRRLGRGAQPQRASQQTLILVNKVRTQSGPRSAHRQGG